MQSINLLEDDMEEVIEWWQDQQFVTELDHRYEDMESGRDKGFTVSQLEESVKKLRKKRYD